MDAGARDALSLGAPGPFTELTLSFASGSRTPRFATGPGRLLPSYQVDPGDSTEVPFLAIRELTEGAEPGWLVSRYLTRHEDLFVNWADYPSIVRTSGDTVVAHWLQRNGPGTYAYQVRLAFSDDGGRTWSESVVPHETQTETEHGFVTLVSEPGGVQAVWLDGRAYETGPAEEMSLRTARVSRDGATDEVVLDARTCDCCQTGAVAVGDTLLVVYRGRSAGEVRDIEIVRRIDGSWTSPATIHDDGWEIDACPVNGPAIAATGREVLVSWFTAADGDARVFVSRSVDGGTTFDEPVRIDDGRPIGRVAVLALPDGTFAVAWVEAVETGGAEVRVRRVTGQAVSPSRTVAGTSESRASGFPTLAARNGDLLVAWTDPHADRVRMARGPLP